MTKSSPLKVGTTYTFDLEDHGDLCVTDERITAVVEVYRGNLNITLKQRGELYPVGEIYLELYSGDLAVNVYDKDHYCDDSERFILHQLELSDATPEEILERKPQYLKGENP